MAVKLTPMDEKIFKDYYEQSMKDYAYEHVKAGNWKEEEAMQKAKEQFEQLLPNGLATKNHYLFSVLAYGEAIGSLWLYVTATEHEKKAFIYDVELEKDQRGKGYGKETMRVLDAYAEAENISQIRLHVFAHNERAIALYNQTGFEMTGHHMLKKLI